MFFCLIGSMYLYVSPVVSGIGAEPSRVTVFTFSSLSMSQAYTSQLGGMAEWLKALVC
jgi:hypothetical protein